MSLINLTQVIRAEDKYVHPPPTQTTILYHCTISQSGDLLLYIIAFVLGKCLSITFCSQSILMSCPFNNIPAG